MTIRTLLYVVLALTAAVLVLANWSMITLPTTLNLLIGSVSLPLGVVMLCAVLAALAIDLVVFEWHQQAWRRERRSLIAEREQMRKLAEAAEASRLNELRERLERELAEIRLRLDRLLERSAPEALRQVSSPQKD